jgi:hypothetical protein
MVSKDYGFIYLIIIRFYYFYFIIFYFVYFICINIIYNMASKKCWCKSVWSLFGNKRTKKRHNRRRRATRRRNMRGG